MEKLSPNSTLTSDLHNEGSYTAGRPRNYDDDSSLYPEAYDDILSRPEEDREVCTKALGRLAIKYLA